MAPRGRPPTPLDPNASCGARLGAELRTLRTEAKLTLEALANMVGCCPQHISEVERAKSTPSLPLLGVVERALDAPGRLAPLLPAVLLEREQRRQERDAARKAAKQALRCQPPHSEAAGDDADVQPTNRRGLLEAGAGAAAALAVTGAAPASAGAVDPDLPAQATELLHLLGRHHEVFGSHAVLGPVQRELRAIAQHRERACDELRIAIMRVESRHAAFAAWLSEDTGDQAAADAWGDHALRLARESRYPDMVAFAHARQSIAAGEIDARRAAELAEAGMRVRGASAQTRAWCARLAAVSHARMGDAAAAESRIADAYELLEDTDSPAPPWAGGFRVTLAGIRADEATCYRYLQPRKAIALYERALSDWPRAEILLGGIHQARLAVACVATGELDRARAEGRKAYAIARATKSGTIERELRRLGALLQAA